MLQGRPVAAQERSCLRAGRWRGRAWVSARAPEKNRPGQACAPRIDIIGPRLRSPPATSAWRLVNVIRYQPVGLSLSSCLTDVDFNYKERTGGLQSSFLVRCNMHPTTARQILALNRRPDLEQDRLPHIPDRYYGATAWTRLSETLRALRDGARSVAIFAKPLAETEE